VAVLIKVDLHLVTIVAFDDLIFDVVKATKVDVAPNIWKADATDKALRSAR